MSYTPWTTRTVGIEMEMTSVRSNNTRLSLSEIASAIAAGLAGVAGARPVQNAGGYVHSAGRSWDVKTDASCGFEVASPAFTLDAEGDSEELKAACNALAALRPRIDRSCGLHVWVNCSDFTWQNMQQLLALWCRYEPMYFEMLPASRKNNTYCQPMRKTEWAGREGGHISAVRAALSATNERQLRNTQRFQKYSSLNVSRWWQNGMVEFRLHSGTVDYTKIRNWVKMLTAIVNRVKHPTMSKVRTSLNITERTDAERANGNFSTTYFAHIMGLTASEHNPDVPASNMELLHWIEARRRQFNPNHRAPVRGPLRATAGAGSSTDGE